MKHLPIPFEQTAIVTIKLGSKLILKFESELATSPIEHFQGLLYRKKLKDDHGVLLVFENTALPTYVNTKVQFAVDTIQFDEKGEITHLGSLQPSKSSGVFITSYQAKHLLMVPSGFIKKYKLISSNESIGKKQKPFVFAVKLNK